MVLAVAGSNPVSHPIILEVRSDSGLHSEMRIRGFQRTRLFCLAGAMVAGIFLLGFLQGCDRAEKGAAIPSMGDGKDVESDRKWFSEFIGSASGTVRVSTAQGLKALSDEDSKKVLEILRTHRSGGQTGHFIKDAILIQVPNKEGVPGATAVQMQKGAKRLAYGTYVFKVANRGELSKIVERDAADK